MESASTTTALCRHCNAELAEFDEPIAVDGTTEPEFVNKAGYRYELRLIDDAPGAVASGEATLDESWLPGFTWQRMFCRQCSTHIGWLFRSKTRVMCGLIVDEIPPE